MFVPWSNACEEGLYFLQQYGLIQYSDRELISIEEMFKMADWVKKQAEIVTKRLDTD